MKSPKPLVSILIPVYKEPRVLGELLDLLAIDEYPSKEIIIVADEPSPEVIKIISKFEHKLKDKIKFKVNERRVGKVNALNTAAKMARGDLLLFLDNDVIPVTPLFISKTVKEMREADIGEIEKEIIQENILSKMVYFDYLAYNYGNIRFYKDLGFCVGFNGAAFAIWKETFTKLEGFKRGLAEDLDLATRSFLLGMSFKFISSARVLNKAPSSFKEWFKQRKRWAIGIGIWLKRYGRHLSKLHNMRPRLILSSLITLYPSSSLVLPFSLYMFLNAFLGIPHAYLVTLAALITLMLLFYRHYSKIAKELRLRISFPYFVLYYLLYSSLWLLITITGIVKGVLSDKDLKLEDWVP
ncbi:MAG: hypothetical protein DRJ41_01625 [Thermoprotei archaeon]|nr:MAG: hypothetical protein DRJ41_01625 [Thermoprotei archaeon]